MNIRLYSLEVFAAICCLERMNIDYQLNEHATNIYDDTGTTGLLCLSWNL